MTQRDAKRAALRIAVDLLDAAVHDIQEYADDDHDGEIKIRSGLRAIRDRLAERLERAEKGDKS